MAASVHTPNPTEWKRRSLPCVSLPCVSLPCVSLPCVLALLQWDRMHRTQCFWVPSYVNQRTDALVACGAVLCCAVLCCAVLCCAVLANRHTWPSRGTGRFYADTCTNHGAADCHAHTQLAIRRHVLAMEGPMARADELAHWWPIQPRQFREYVYTAHHTPHTIHHVPSCYVLRHTPCPILLCTAPYTMSHPVMYCAIHRVPSLVSDVCVVT